MDQAARNAAPGRANAGARAPEFRRAFAPDEIMAFADRLAAVGSFESGFRGAGTPAARRAASMIEEEMRAIGLAGVRQETFPVFAWDGGPARLVVEGPAPYTCVGCVQPPTPGTPAEGLRAPLVDAGGGTAQDYATRDVRGKIAFVGLDMQTLQWPGVAAYEAALHGAVAVLFYYVNEYAQHPSGQALHLLNGMCPTAIPLVQIPWNAGQEIARRLCAGEAPAVLHAQVQTNPRGTGRNVIGLLPGVREPDSYLFLNAHYDGWFQGYWDNAVGVGAMLALARAWMRMGYRPQHTWVFSATDAEEFGAADTVFDWLQGAQSMLAGHPEWVAGGVAAFNIDTLSPHGRAGLEYVCNGEILDFAREALAGSPAPRQVFAQPEIAVHETMTPWTEQYSFAYFGISCLAPAIDRSLFSTVYHTQFDTRDVVAPDKMAEEVIALAGVIMALDRRPWAPYNFVRRADAMLASVDRILAHAAGIDLAPLDSALTYWRSSAAQAQALLGRVALFPAETAGAINAQLRHVARYLLGRCCCLGDNFWQRVLYRHEAYQAQLHMLNSAIEALRQDDAAGALRALTTPGPAHGAAATESWPASLAPYVSHRTYCHYGADAIRPARRDLWWGQGRATQALDCWKEIQSLGEKVPLGVDDFQAERRALARKRSVVIGRLRQALLDLTETAAGAASLLPLELLRAYVADAESQVS